MKLCPIDGCGGRVWARGLCQKHYRRLQKYGNPFAGRTPDGAALRFLEANKDYAGNECLLWPYGYFSSGYGSIRKNGRARNAHAVMLELMAGPSPTTRHDAAHSCGVRACVNPKHLRWATKSDNCMDKLIHGTHSRGERNWKAKLTKTQVLEIRELLEQGMLQREIGRLYGVSPCTVNAIRTGRNWSHLDSTDARSD